MNFTRSANMNPKEKTISCLITAGPTYENLDKVRRLTNFSSGRLGSELSSFLISKGYRVVLCLSETATFQEVDSACEIHRFSTAASLIEILKSQAAKRSYHGVFHAAAVGDFQFGQLYQQNPEGKWSGISSGKISTRIGTIRAELIPTRKIIRELRQFFPNAIIAGWKYEVDGSRDQVNKAGREQIMEYQTDLCVTNGTAYGNGFGLVQSGIEEIGHVEDKPGLFQLLELALKL